MSVKYIQPIFAPNIELMRKNLESLRTFFDYYDKMGYEFQCVFGGYAATDEMWVEIERYIESRDVEGRVKSIVHRYADNYGKAYVINDLTGRYLSDAEYFLTADSDILFNINQPDMIARLVEAFEHAKKIDLNPALIALFQEEANCHVLEACYQNKYYYQGSFEYEMICHPSGEGGVAGGCLFVSSEFWNKIGGYKVLGVYAADDGNLMRDAKKSGYSFLLSNSIRCIHPFENNKEYQDWKVKTSTKIMELDEAVADSNKFWETASKFKSSYIICYSATSEYRTRNLNVLIKYIRKNFSNVEIIVAEQGSTKSTISDIDQHVFIESTGIFRKSELLNKAVMASNSEILILSDNDIILDVRSYDDMLKDLQEFQAVNPYYKVLDLPLDVTDRFIETLDRIDDSRGTPRPSIVFAGGVFGIRRKDFCRIGGFDESFVGWGGEDDALTHKIYSLCTNKTLNYVSYHLWHDRNVNGTPHHEHYQKNLESLISIRSMGVDALVKYCVGIRKQFEFLYEEGL